MYWILVLAGALLLDLIEQEKPDAEPIGIDISTNVIEALERKKQREGHRWQVMKGDALQLDQYVQPGAWWIRSFFHLFCMSCTPILSETDGDLTRTRLSQH